jgi:AAA domain
MGAPPGQPAINFSGGVDLLAGLRDGPWLDAQVFPPLAYAVPGVIPEGSTLLVGPPKAGKSLFDLGVGLSVASGGRALSSIPVEERPVLYLALEDGHRRMQERCRSLLRGEPIPKGFHYLLAVAPGLVLDTIAAWLDEYGDDGPLVMLDTLGKVMPTAAMGETTYQRDYRIGSELKALADEHGGTSLLVNHHDRKAASDDFVDAVSGTHGLAGAADTIVVLARPRGEPAGVLKVTGRDVDEAEYAVVLTRHGWMLDGATLEEAARNAAQAKATAGVGDRMAEIIALVGQHPEGIGPTAIGLLLGLDPSTAGKYLARAYDGDRIGKTGRGLYTPVQSVQSV